MTFHSGGNTFCYEKKVLKKYEQKFEKKNLLQAKSGVTLGLAYNKHFDAKKIAHCKWVLVVAELVITGVLLVVQYSYQDVILSNLMLTTH